MFKNLQEFDAKLGDIARSLEPLASRTDEFTAEEATEFEAMRSELANVTTARAAFAVREETREAVRAIAARPANTESGDAPGSIVKSGPYDLSDIQLVGVSRGTVGNQFKSKALAALEASGLEAVYGDHADRLIRSKDSEDGFIARRIVATGSDAYRSAWGKVVTGRENSLTTGERDALAIADDISRAVAEGSGSTGGFMVPFTLDTTIIGTGNLPISEIRAHARKVTTVTNSWNGITSAGVSGRWAAEASEASDNSPTVASPAIPVNKFDIFVPYSIEAEQDIAALSTDLRSMITEEQSRLEATAFALGTGSGQPTGIITAIAAVSGSRVPSVTAAQYTKEDVDALLVALPTRYRQNAVFMAELQTILETKALYAGIFNGDAYYSELGGNRTLQGHPLIENSDMDGTLTAAATNDILVYGDFSRYVIVDRIGLNVEFIPHLFGTNGRPTGQRGWYCYARVGANVVDSNAFRLLRVTKP